ncbi:chorismate synthase [Cloacibacillus evryensis]|uniref:chorismate synthase n=1 Tax=Cloacibacillus evryensis TaxID=508460 RepID=UPI0026DF2BC3|nr:chorismate synthase [Cloacibacillus evryensis]
MKFSIFGESHGPAIGVLLEDVPAGAALNMEEIAFEMGRRAPGKNALSTARKEADSPEVLSGVYNGFTTGAPLCAMIRNTDARSGDYSLLKRFPRPGHADYTAAARYGGFADMRGSGQFSGRLTAPLVFAGAVAKQLLARRGIFVGAHICSINGIKDTRLEDSPLFRSGGESLLRAAAHRELPVLDEGAGERMREAIAEAKRNGDSLGGVIECAATGLEAGIGEPGADSLESLISRNCFAVPGVKGIEFGAGFAFAEMRGSEANDPMEMKEGRVVMRSNNNGGISGGISTGAPLLFRAALRPTSSIAREQDTVDMERRADAKLVVPGRHDPCIVHRAVPAIEAAAALALLEAVQKLYGIRCI